MSFVTVEAVSLETMNVSWLNRDEVLDKMRMAAYIRSWLDAKDIVLARRLAELADITPSAPPPEADIAAAGNVSRSQAAKNVKRARAAADVPEVEDLLASGGVTVEHVDALGRALARLSAEHRLLLAADGARLAAIAARSTPEAFDKFLKLEIARLDQREAGDRLERQKRACRLRSWTDRDTGMVCGRFELDPESGLAFLGRLDNAVDTLFHDRTPDTCPAGDGRQDHLRALALIRLVDGRLVSDDGEESNDMCGTDSRTEVSVLIDLETLLSGLHEHSVIGNGHGIDLPVESYRRMACQHAIIPIVLDSDGVVLDMGRFMRLATTAQRRALIAMYDTCAVPGCCVNSRHCQPHHIRWWRNMGFTDIDNLIPLCSRHHHAAHEGGWQLHLAPNRSLTITYPDGTIQTTGPPNRKRVA